MAILYSEVLLSAHGVAFRTHVPIKRPNSGCAYTRNTFPKWKPTTNICTIFPTFQRKHSPPVVASQVLSGFEAECITTPGAVQSALHRAEEMSFSLEIRPSGDRRVVPGRSVLVSTVVDAVIRRRLDLPFDGGRAVAKLEAAADVTLTEGMGINPAADTRKISGESATCVVASVNPGVDGGVNTRMTAAPGKNKRDEEHETYEAMQARYVAELLSTSDVDVREAAIKATKKVFGEAARRRKLVMSPQGSYLIWSGAAKALMEERHPPNVRRLVRLLARVGLHLRGYSLPPAAVDSLWKHLRKLCDGEGGPGDAHAGALEVMGVIIHLDRRRHLVDGMQTGDEGGSSFAAVRFKEYARFLDRAVDPTQPVVARAAAAASLVSSGILSTAAPTSTTSAAGAAAACPTPTASSSAGNDTEGAARSIPRTGAAAGDTASDRRGEQRDLSSGTFGRLWFVALSLLQDDDERVRSFAARACSAAVSSSSAPAQGAPNGAGEHASSRSSKKRQCNVGYTIRCYFAKILHVRDRPVCVPSNGYGHAMIVGSLYHFEQLRVWCDGCDLSVGCTAHAVVVSTAFGGIFSVEAHVKVRPAAFAPRRHISHRSRLFPTVSSRVLPLERFSHFVVSWTLGSDGW